MTTLTNSLLINLGWTLLHTIWQAALILLVVKSVQHFIPRQHSSARYIVNCAALIFVVASGLTTFIDLNKDQPSYAANFEITLPSYYSENKTTSAALATIVPSLVQEVNNHMTWLINAWLVGVIFFSIRFLGSLAYIRFLKRRIISISDIWKNRVGDLSTRIRLNQVVVLAESLHISKPIAIGYLKPMILLPVGLLSGLPTDQVEAILLHELTHIKRNDFIVNIFQSIIETLLFFNPSIWIISGMIRKEREYYCDDQVVRSGFDALSYAKALANVEEATIGATPVLALALNKNKYQVFNRIKRIMETSVNQHPKKVRPIVLIILIGAGLVCASWLSINPKNGDNTINELTTPKVITVAGDTTVRKNKEKSKDKNTENNKEKDKEKNKDKEKDKDKSASYSRKVITTYDEDGTPHEEVIEEYNGDEELRSIFSSPGSFSFSMPAFPSVPSIPSIPSIPSVPSIPSIPFDMDFSYHLDDGGMDRFHMSAEDEAKWEAFGNEMSKRFEEFGKENENFDQMMEEWADKLGQDFSFHFDNSIHNQLRDRHDDERFEERFQNLENLDEHLDRLDETLREQLGHLDNNLKEYEVKLADQLVSDGYLKKGEKVNSINWGDGKLTVNGIQIKEKDMPKYEALNNKYFKEK